MTPEQYQEFSRRFTNLDHEVAKLRTTLNRIHLELLGKASRDDVLVLRTALDDLGEDVNRFTSDVNDRLSRRVNKDAAFVGMPVDKLDDENAEDAEEDNFFLRRIHRP